MTDEPNNRIAALNAALAAAQGEFPPITRDKEVKTKTYSYSYAPLEDVLAAVRPVLAKHGLSVSQLLEDIGAGPAIRTELRHKDGGVLGSSFPLGFLPETEQQLGSKLTYRRRYALQAILGIATEDDDDGKAAAVDAGPAMITEAQRRRLFAVAAKNDVKAVQLREIIASVTGDRSTASIPADRYDEIVVLVEADAEIEFETADPTGGDEPDRTAGGLTIPAVAKPPTR